MPKDEETKARKRVIVEEMPAEEAPAATAAPEPQISEEAASTEIPTEVTEKPEEKEEPAPEPARVSETSPQKSPSIALWIIIPGFFLLGALLGGIFFYQKGIKSGDSQTPAPSATATSSETPAPTPSTEVDLEKYNIKILNGSGIAGEAGKVRSLLEKAGFKIASTGNASTYDYTKTVIQTKSDMDKDFVSALSKALSESYSVDSKTQTLPESPKDEVVVIVGSSKN